MTPPKRGTYQTTIVTETWVKKKGVLTPRVQYRTTFGGEVLDHNSILNLVRDLHAEKKGEASALIEVFVNAEAMLRFRKASEELGEYAADLDDKLKAALAHLEEYPVAYEGACEPCPYPEEQKIREGACGKCSIGDVKFWLEDHRKHLGFES